MKITAAKLKSINGKPYTGKSEVSDGDNLSLRISPKGKITFQIRYRIEGKAVRYKIGTYPEMTLANARETCEEKMSLVRRKLDPRKMAAVNSIEEVRVSSPTISDCIDFWYKEHCSENRDRPKEIKYRIVSSIADEWLQQYIPEMKKYHFVAMYKSMCSESKKLGRAPGYAYNSLIEFKAVLKYCLKHDFINNGDFTILNPKDFTSEYASREHFLTIEECRLIWSNIDNLPMTDRNKIILKCVMIFGCRISELYTALKSDFDLKNKLFIVRKENTKTQEKSIYRPIHDILLDDLQYLKDQSPGYKFMFHNRDGDRPASSASISRIANTCYTNIKGVEEFRMHDFRRTISTHLTDIMCPTQYTEKLLGHKLVGILAKYNKSRMLKQLAICEGLWVDIIQGRPTPDDCRFMFREHEDLIV